MYFDDKNVEKVVSGFLGAMFCPNFVGKSVVICGPSGCVDTHRMNMWKQNNIPYVLRPSSGGSMVSVSDS